MEESPRPGAPADPKASEPPAAEHSDRALAETAVDLGSDNTLTEPDPESAERAALETGEPPDAFVGRTLSGLYRVERKLGEGGMGAVYLVEHVHLGKQFAVKVLSRHIAQSTHAVERLRQEAVAASRIEHDNIVHVMSFDRTEEGDVFIVMEFLRGSDLAGAIEHGPLPLARALRIAIHVARALGAAHEAGIVHRDLKPENVFLVQKGAEERAKVLDFGISKVKSADAEQVRMTKTGQLVGTPLYMSPEQAKGEADVDLRADVYALGVMLYEMLTGTPPFHGTNYFQLLWKHGNETPETPTARAPERQIPAEVERIVMRCLEKDRDARYASMAELEAELAAVMPASGAVSLPPRVTPVAAPASRGGSRWKGAVALLVGVGLLALGIASFVGSSPPRGASEIGRPSEPPPRAPFAPGPPEVAPPPSTPPPAPPPTGLSDAVLVRFESEPSGALVQLGDQVLGETPFARELPRGAAQSFRFTRRGFVDQSVEAVAADGLEVRARLARRARDRGDGPPPSSGLPIKTTW